jgi:hypothetical protein
MLACLALFVGGGLLGLHVYRLETRLASLEASAGRQGVTTPEPRPAGAPASRAVSTPPTAVNATRRTLSLDAGAAREVARRLGGELGLEAARVDGLTRFLMAFHLRAALASARAHGEDLSELEASHAELLRGDLRQELLALRLSSDQLSRLTRETPGLEALLTR